MRRNAMTLVELLLSLSLSVVILVPLVTLLAQSARGYVRGDAEASVATELQRVMETIRRDLQNAVVEVKPGWRFRLDAEGHELTFEMMDAETPGGVLDVHYRFEPAAGGPGRLFRSTCRRGSADSGTASTVSALLTDACLRLYSMKLPTILPAYQARVHRDYSPLFVRIELQAELRPGGLAEGAVVSRRLVTSIALEPATSRMRNPAWNSLDPLL
jgi:type II secretory pathway pseudopilin PulG